MEQLKKVLHTLVPDLMSVVKRRSDVLNYIAAHQPVGRRLIAQYFGLSERRLRTEIENLRELGLVQVEKNGISLTDLSLDLLPQLDSLFEKEKHLHVLEQQLQSRFNCQCRVVSGNSEVQSIVYSRMAQVISEELNRLLPFGPNIVAITGGNTLASVIPHLSSDLAHNRQFKIVPARGGGSGALTIQANTLSHDLAEILHGETTSLFVPEQLSQALYDSLIQEKQVANTLSLLKSANCLIYSVGNSTIMAERRGVSIQEQEDIVRKQAVGEAMGVFFNKNGQIVHRLARIGLVLEDLEHLPCKVLVVGGQQKAQALVAYLKLASQQTLMVVDEALAHSILREETL